MNEAKTVFNKHTLMLALALSRVTVLAKYFGGDTTEWPEPIKKLDNELSDSTVRTINNIFDKAVFEHCDCCGKESYDTDR